MFAYQLLKELRKNEKPYISIQELCTRIAPIVSNNSEQTPLCRPIRNTGDQGGEFVFVASTGAIEIASYTELKAESARLEQERMELELIKMEIEKKKIEAERKKLAAIPETTVDSSDDGMADNKLDSDKRHSLAVFPISEFGILSSSLENQKKYIDFILKYTSDMPNVMLTHSFYPYNKEYTAHHIKSIREIINKNIEKEIWYGNSRYSKNKPDLKILNELSRRINSSLILTFKIESQPGREVDRFTYTGYLVDIDNNISFKEIDYSEQSSPFTDFTIVEMMTKKLFKSYLKSNSQIGTKY